MSNKALVLSLLSVVFTFSAFAEESFTITTYYPSPYGSYNELQTNKLAVGDTNGDGQMTSLDQPPENGQLYTARSIIFKPQSSLPDSNVREGELVYNNSDNKFYYYSGSEWEKLGYTMAYCNGDCVTGKCTLGTDCNKQCLSEGGTVTWQVITTSAAEVVCRYIISGITYSFRCTVE